MDKYNLRKIILSYLNQLDLGQKLAQGIQLPQKKFSNLIICGMGGSSLPGDLLINYLQNNKGLPLPIFINRTYHLPSDASKKSLIFISSYSGNTEETISCFKEALKIGATIVAFTNGGKVEKIAQKNNTSLVKYQIDYPNFQPRYAITYAFMAMYQVLTNLKITDIITKFPKIRPSLMEKEGKRLAQKIKGQTPIIYSSDKLRAIAKIWKIKINENSKTPAFWNYFPELNHNEMVGFTNPHGKFFLLCLMAEDDEKIIKKRMEITLKLCKERGLQGEIIKISGKDGLENMLNSLALGDWVSYYLALEYNQDPTPVDMVEDFKKKIKQ